MTNDFTTGGLLITLFVVDKLSVSSFYVDYYWSFFFYSSICFYRCFSAALGSLLDPLIFLRFEATIVLFEAVVELFFLGKVLLGWLKRLAKNQC